MKILAFKAIKRLLLAEAVPPYENPFTKKTVGPYVDLSIAFQRGKPRDISLGVDAVRELRDWLDGFLKEHPKP